MGIFSITIQVGDPNAQHFESFEALVDTGSSNTTLPAFTLRHLGVGAYDTALFELADGSQTNLPLGRTWVRINGRQELTQVVFAEEESQPTLGAITREEMGLGVDPIAQRLIPVPRRRGRKIRRLG